MIHKIYEDGQYMEMTGDWHREDSAWKADQIIKLLASIDQPIRSVVDVGCGAGEILSNLSRAGCCQGARMVGFDLSPQAIELCRNNINDKAIEFRNEDPFAPENEEQFDLLLAIDVFEHVPDYLGFLEKCQKKATFKIYHIPLDISVPQCCDEILINRERNLGICITLQPIRQNLLWSIPIILF